MPRQKADFQFPLTATDPILVSGKSDHSLRRLLYDFFTVSARMETVKRYLGERLGITAPQYTIIMAVAELQGKTGVSVGRVGDYLHVTGPFVTMESGKLQERLPGKTLRPSGSTGYTSFHCSEGGKSASGSVSGVAANQ